MQLRTQSPTGPVENLSGLIERVTFFNEENGWAVLKVKVKRHRNLVAVVGSLPSISAGEWVTAEGGWIQDREFGLQFRAVMLNSTAPNRRVEQQDGAKVLGAARPAQSHGLRIAGRCLSA